MLETTDNIKIPYPTEGVIRTAQLDDTVTPQNSVQLAVNMNFDRIGAIQTRPGITQYATSEAQKIRNYGTLNNQILASGFDQLFRLGDILTTTASSTTPSACKVDDTHYLLCWHKSGTGGLAQVFSADMDTGLMAAIGTPLTFDATQAFYNSCIKVDATHFMNIWSGAGSDGFVQIFQVAAGTYAVTALGSALEFDAADDAYNTCAQIDANHFIVFYTGTSSIGIADVFEVNLSTWAVTQPGSPLTFDGTQGTRNTCRALGDGTHFVNFWSGTSDHGFARTFSVNTSTWAITALSTALTFDSSAIDSPSVASLGDGQHFINFWNGGASSYGLAQVFSVNLSTFAITTAGSQLTFSTTGAVSNSAVSMGDGQHFVDFWRNNVQTEYGQIFSVNLSTFAITTQSLPLSGMGKAVYNTAVLATAYHVVNFWTDLNNSNQGQASVFKMTAVPVAQNFLYAQKADGDIDNWNGTIWTNRRTGLRTVGKARFSQYLNYIWMVNGNAAIGDPVATSNGGTFGTTLVPDQFPPGDFIHAGFEGRVWVADKTYGIIYYTDIVQFTPPDIYILTYDPTVNFIKDISPQDGESFTALFRVPRALLVFTEDHIFRIYGATSIDAYPAYDVGTYSQESIIQTKTGIFFHHSSGFYQFDYGSQPVEISRRVIDFVKAIPRSQYPDIVGVYDGFDAVEWAVGTVVVEGVTFSNCVMRYTISTQIWTIYDYVNNVITAMISYDDGTTLNHLAGTLAGKTGALDIGTTDFGDQFYFEMIDRWRAFSAMYAHIKTASGFNVYSENAAGTKLQYQIQKSPANVWRDIDEVDEENNSLFPNSNTDDFDVMRLRLSGTTNGTPIVIHGIEILSITNKGYNEN